MRFTLLLLLLLSTVFANDEVVIIDDVLVSLDNKIYVSVDEIEEEDIDNKIFIKIILNKKALEKGQFYLRILHSYNALKSLNVDAKKNDNFTLITLDKNSPKELFLAFESNFPDMDLDILLHEKEGFIEFEKNEFLFYGLAYGVIFSAFLYNFVLFIYNRSKTFFYYSCFQLSLLFLLLINVITPDFLKPLYNYIPISGILGSITFIFAILFNRSFLDLKSYFPKLDVFLAFLVYAHIIDIFIMLIFKDSLFDDVPIYVMVFILVLTSFLVYRQGFKIAIFYILGWLVILLSTLYVEIGLYEYPDIYALHFGLPLESLILSFTLGYKMRELERQKESHEKMLIHQNKLASMGEMISNIAHQYRQPLTHLGYILMNIKSAHEHKELDDKYLNSKIDTANKQLQFMSDTIDNFRDFYKQNRQKADFKIYNAVQSAVDIITPVLKQREITLLMQIDEEVQIRGFENEYSQVVLNLLSNAKDSLIYSEVKRAKIEISLELEENKTKLVIKDNGAGVPLNIKEKIFEPYFSTKFKNSGIGLYMSSMIIQEHFDGKLYLQDCEKGAIFVIEV